jgi:GNAT superfamily N-acetyltransferase
MNDPPQILVRPAEDADLAAIVALYADDELHAGVQPAELTPAHVAAFAAIARQPDNHVYVAELTQHVVGTFQLTFIHQLSYGGCLVAQVESVHVSSSLRSRGVGARMMEWAIAEARRRGCLRVQLTSNVQRPRAHAFYERLGFTASHKGMKLYLERQR